MKIMSHADHAVIDGIVVEEEISFTFTQLSQACSGSADELLALVDEGVLGPRGTGPGDWVFDGHSLRTARTALRLVRELELGAAGAALVLELLAELEALRSRLRLAGLR
jgi:chaperone modulatory protein CbpM